MRLVLAAILVCACSHPATRESGPGDSGGGGGSGAGEGAAAAAGGGVAIAVDGELGGCQPAGVWRATASFPGGGDCAARPEPMTLEVAVSARGDGYALELTGDGELVPDRLAARDGVCALGFTVRRGGGAAFVHLLASGEGRGVWDGAGCSEPIELAVSRGARSAE